MATGQKFRGFVGQSMSGRRARLTAASYSYPPGSYTWTCPTSGWWRFLIWGAGGSGNTATSGGGGSGALYIAERYLTRGQRVSLVVGAPSPSVGDNSTATFPSGEVITAGGGSETGAAGTATANKTGDIVYAGSEGGATTAAGANGLGDAPGSGGAASGAFGGGAGAPGYGTHRGGDGSTAGTVLSGETPAGGGALAIINGSAAQTLGGGGLALIYRVRLPV